MSLRRRLERLEKAAQADGNTERQEEARECVRRITWTLLEGEVNACFVKGGEPDVDTTRREYARLLEIYGGAYDPERDDPFVLSAVENAREVLRFMRRSVRDRTA